MRAHAEKTPIEKQRFIYNCYLVATDKRLETFTLMFRVSRSTISKIITRGLNKKL